MKKIEKGTIIRTVILAMALINQALTISGKNPLPFSDAEVENVVAVLITIGTSLWSWWKNNSFTQEAIEADEALKAAKAGKSNGN